MKNGFTLIELLIMLAILGILASIAYPAISGHSQVDTTIVSPVRTVRMQCINGVLFTVDPAGEIAPAVDTNAKNVKC